jgi:hypothetical protein
MEADIRFFQAAATAIPTLFIAMAVSAKVFHPDNDGGMFAPTSLRDVITNTVSMSTFATAEMICLATLVTNRPNFLSALIVGVLIGFQIVMLIGSSMSAAIDKFRPEKSWHQTSMALITLFAFLVPIGVFVMLIYAQA